MGEDTNILDFDDARNISAYAVSAFQWACGSGMMSGTSDITLSTAGTATHAQAATMFMHFCTGIVK